MKKIFIIILVVAGAFIVLNKKEEKKESIVDNYQEDRAVFISYIDYSVLKNKTKDEIKNIIDEMIHNIEDNNYNMIILQVRSFFDAIYNSSIFKSSKVVVENEGDVLNLDILSYFTKKSHEKNIKLYAWVNPYRIRNTNDYSDINKENIYYKYLFSNEIYIGDDGIYINPSSEIGLKFIIDGLKEIAVNYDVDGILFDDYFYPNDFIDNDNYNLYKEKGGEKDINNYRRDNIYNLIKTSFLEIKKINKNILFGISPGGNINNNLNDEYLDIEKVINDGYIDFVMPQLYYGFENESLPFTLALDNWEMLVKDKNVSLYVALSIYKSGNVDKYAGGGKNEWIEKTDIIKKEVILSRNANNYKGFAIFRYDFLFNFSRENENLLRENENLKEILKK